MSPLLYSSPPNVRALPSYRPSLIVVKESRTTGLGGGGGGVLGAIAAEAFTLVAMVNGEAEPAKSMMSCVVVPSSSPHCPILLTARGGWGSKSLRRLRSRPAGRRIGRTACVHDCSLCQYGQHVKGEGAVPVHVCISRAAHSADARSCRRINRGPGKQAAPPAAAGLLPDCAAGVIARARAKEEAFASCPLCDCRRHVGGPVWCVSRFGSEEGSKQALRAEQTYFAATTDSIPRMSS